MQFSITDEALIAETQLENIMRIQKKQIILFVVLMTWPLVPFIIAKMFNKNVITAAEYGLTALGLA